MTGGAKTGHGYADDGQVNPYGSVVGRTSWDGRKPHGQNRAGQTAEGGGRRGACLVLALGWFLAGARATLLTLLTGAG